jgi:hypothetical protein
MMDGARTWPTCSDTTVATMRRDGVAVWNDTSEKPTADFDGYDDVMALATEFADSPYVAHETERALRGEARGGLKPFLIRQPDMGTLDRDHPLIRFVLDDDLLAVVAATIGESRLHHVEIWVTVPWLGRQKVWSHSWHRDPEDSRLIKAFLYVRDVDDESGPFEYILTSHRSLFDLCSPGRYLPADKYDQLPPEKHKRFTAPAGTLVLANTSGLHRGGYGTKSRVSVLATYVTAGCPHQPLVTITGQSKMEPTTCSQN